MHGHAARAGLPEVSLGAAQSRKFLPGFAAVRGFENRGVFRAGVNRVRIGERRFEMPDALELPRMLRAVVHMCEPTFPRRRTYCFHLWENLPGLSTLRIAAGRIPGFAAVIRALDDLARTNRWSAMRKCDSDQRAFEVMNLPTGEMRAADVPILRLASDVRTDAPFVCQPKV